jgi:hypothetical protein
MPKTADTPSLAAQLAGPLIVEAATEAGPLAVFPIITGREASTPFVALAEAMEGGATVAEVGTGATVSTIVVRNPLEVPVLLYEGEEVLGAQQNRTFDVSVLVPPRAELEVPVSCVESGRWDGARRDEAFTCAPQVAHPRLRGRKNERVREQLDAALAPRADQGEVWAEVTRVSAALDTESPTQALHGVFERHRGRLGEVAGKVPMHCSQVGMLAAVGGRFVVLDLVARVEAFARLQPRLAQGYALDALTADAAPAPSLQDARDFVALLLEAPAQRSPAPGLGEHLRFAFGGLGGTALAHDGGIVTLSAFAQA